MLLYYNCRLLTVDTHPQGNDAVLLVRTIVTIQFKVTPHRLRHTVLSTLTHKHGGVETAHRFESRRDF